MLAAPGRSTPLARLVCFPAACATEHLALPFRVCSPLGVGLNTPRSVLGCKAARPPTTAAGHPPTRGNRRVQKPRLAYLAAWLGFCSLPVQVWAAPKELIEAISHVADLAGAVPCDGEVSGLNDGATPEPFSWRPVVAQVQADSLEEVYGAEPTVRSGSSEANVHVQAPPQAEAALTPQEELAPMVA